MDEYLIIDLDDKNKLAIVDMLIDNNKKYFLTTLILDNEELSDEFKIYIYNDKLNALEEIEYTEEYNKIQSMFDNRLEKMGSRFEWDEVSNNE